MWVIVETCENKVLGAFLSETREGAVSAAALMAVDQDIPYDQARPAIDRDGHLERGNYRVSVVEAGA